jgi:hypothetical protein
MNVSESDIRIDAPNRERVVGRLAGLVDSFYVSPEVGKRMSDSLHARLQRGVYDRYSNGASLAIGLRADLDAIAHDKHLQIFYSLLPRGPAPSPQRAAPEPRESEANCPVWKTEQLEGNVGYLRFDGFVDPEECPSTIVRAMTALAGDRALIIDLRENAGGGIAGSTPLLESYLFDHRTHLADLSFRNTGEIRQRWTLDSVSGARFGGQKGLRDFGATLSAARTGIRPQALKRATIAQRRRTGMRRLRRALTTTLKSCCLPKDAQPGTARREGTGVVPDVKVPADEALAAALKLIGERAP